MTVSIVRDLIIGGVYEHFKNHKEYVVKSISKDTRDLKELVNYKCLEDNSNWSRPIEEFLDIPKAILNNIDCDNMEELLKADNCRFIFKGVLGDKKPLDIYRRVIELNIKEKEI